MRYLEKYYENESNEWNKEVIIAFSGGKDSTVLLDLVLKVHKKIKSNIYIVPTYAYEITFPETLLFIKQKIDLIRKTNDKVKELVFQKPKLPWNQILKEKGYPIFSKQTSVLLNRIKRVKSKNGLTKWIFKIDTSKFGLSKERLFLLDDNMKEFPKNIHDEYFSGIHEKDYIYSEKCCDYIKGGIKHTKKPCFVGTMASESGLRKNSWINFGCNIISKNKMISRPLSIWNSNDIWKYVYKNKNEITINPKYGFDNNAINWEYSIKKLKYQRLGCISCPYGAHLEKENNRFETLLKESPELYNAQVIKTGMYKILIDMKIIINNDEKYMELFKARWNQIDKWYENFEENLLNLIVQIENYGNYKNYKPCRNKTEKSFSWKYSENEIMQILENYNIKNINKTKIIKKINYLRNKKIRGR